MHICYAQHKTTMICTVTQTKSYNDVNNQEALIWILTLGLCWSPPRSPLLAAPAAWSEWTRSLTSNHKQALAAKANLSICTNFCSGYTVLLVFRLLQELLTPQRELYGLSLTGHLSNGHLSCLPGNLFSHPGHLHPLLKQTEGKQDKMLVLWAKYHLMIKKISCLTLNQVHFSLLAVFIVLRC